MSLHRSSSETQVYVRQMVHEHGSARSDSILSGAEMLMRTLQSLDPEIQRPVVELLLDVFDRASTRRPRLAADRL